MADGSTAPAGLTDANLRELVIGLAPLAAVDSIAGLVARYRDPRERGGTGGEQRDAAAALDAASDRGQLTSHRVAHERFGHLSLDAQRTALWIAQRGGAVRDGALVGVAEWAEVYGRLDGPLAARELAERSKELSRRAGARLRGLKHRAITRGLDAAGAAEIDAERSKEAQAAAAMRLAQETLHRWALGRFDALWEEWRAL